QRVAVVLAVAGAALVVSGQPALSGVFLVPVALAVLHGLVFPWPRYNVPAMPVLLAAAATFVAGVAAARPWREPRSRRALLTAGVPALITLAAAAAVGGLLPEGARVGHVLGSVL